jgi:diguanylate cyclase (GGDEF)-like protein
LLLEEVDDGMRCVAAVPDTLVGLRWSTGPFFRDIVAGGVAATNGEHDLEEWRSVTGGSISPAQPALYLPYCAQGRRRLLMLLRATGGQAFQQAELAVARQFALVGLAGLAAHHATSVEREFHRLRGEVAELRESESEARHNGELLRGIIELLPVGLTVHDTQGRIVLANEEAAARIDLSATEANDGPGDSPSLAMPLVMSNPELDAPPLSDRNEVEEASATPAGGRTWLVSRKQVRFLEETLLLSTSIDITHRKQIESELARRAYSDDLTGLANRAAIQEQVELVLRGNGGDEHFALAFIDLDNFKHINDYYNHTIGDAVLVKVAQRIAGLMRSTDMLARMSGDEFVLLINPVESSGHVNELIDELLRQLKQPFHIEGFELFTTASIGVSLFPEHGRSYEELRRNADSAMYQAKSGAKGAAAFYDLDMGKAAAARMELEQRLRLAIRDRQFCCAFQPKVDIRSQEVVGFETLVRWRDSNADIQPPGSFIGLATELGLIDPITRFVLMEAIGSIDALDEAFGAGKTIAVNVAAKQAGDPVFMRTFVDLLKESGCAERFIVEVTEDAFIAKNQFQSQVLPMLREIGVRVSIDDFGTGYSSLSVLADIPADEIKIDRSFITDIHQRSRSQSILKAIESVSFALGMSVVAEGVETFEELAYLLGATRIRYAQGYHFARPFFLEEGAKTDGVQGDERGSAMGRERQESRETTSARAAVGARTD